MALHTLIGRRRRHDVIDAVPRLARKCVNKIYCFNISVRIRFFVQILMKMNVNISNELNFSGLGCSKLTTSLVNISIKFQTLISEICQYFLLKECEKLLQCKSFSHFFNKNIGAFGYKVVKHLTS